MVNVVFLWLLFDTKSHYATQAGFKLMNLLPQPPEYLNYKCVPSCLALILSFKKRFILFYVYVCFGSHCMCVPQTHLVPKKSRCANTEERSQGAGQPSQEQIQGFFIEFNFLSIFSKKEISQENLNFFPFLCFFKKCKAGILHSDNISHLRSVQP